MPAVVQCLAAIVKDVLGSEARAQEADASALLAAELAMEADERARIAEALLRDRLDAEENLWRAKRLAHELQELLHTIQTNGSPLQETPRGGHRINLPAAIHNKMVQIQREDWDHQDRTDSEGEEEE